MLFFSFCFGFIKFLTDYIIYQGWDDPYVPRTHEGLLKWKYANLNSVDFLFEVITTFFWIVFGILILLGQLFDIDTAINL